MLRITVLFVSLILSVSLADVENITFSGRVFNIFYFPCKADGSALQFSIFTIDSQSDSSSDSITVVCKINDVFVIRDFVSDILGRLVIDQEVKVVGRYVLGEFLFERIIWLKNGEIIPPLIQISQTK